MVGWTLETPAGDSSLDEGVLEHAVALVSECLSLRKLNADSSLQDIHSACSLVLAELLFLLEKAPKEYFNSPAVYLLSHCMRNILACDTRENIDIIDDSNVFFVFADHVSSVHVFQFVSAAEHIWEGICDKVKENRRRASIPLFYEAVAREARQLRLGYKATVQDVVSKKESQGNVKVENDEE